MYVFICVFGWLQIVVRRNASPTPIYLLLSTIVWQQVGGLSYEQLALSCTNQLLKNNYRNRYQTLNARKEFTFSFQMYSWRCVRVLLGIGPCFELSVTLLYILTSLPLWPFFFSLLFLLLSHFFLFFLYSLFSYLRVFIPVLFSYFIVVILLIS